MESYKHRPGFFQKRQKEKAQKTQRKEEQRWRSKTAGSTQGRKGSVKRRTRGIRQREWD